MRLLIFMCPVISIYSREGATKRLLQCTLVDFQQCRPCWIQICLQYLPGLSPIFTLNTKIDGDHSNWYTTTINLILREPLRESLLLPLANTHTHTHIYNIYLYSTLCQKDRRTDNTTQTSRSRRIGKQLRKRKLQHFKIKTTSIQNTVTIHTVALTTPN